MAPAGFCCAVWFCNYCCGFADFQWSSVDPVGFKWFQVLSAISKGSWGGLGGLKRSIGVWCGFGNFNCSRCGFVVPGGVPAMFLQQQYLDYIMYLIIRGRFLRQYWPRLTIGCCQTSLCPHVPPLLPFFCATLVARDPTLVIKSVVVLN